MKSKRNCASDLRGMIGLRCGRSLCCRRTTLLQTIQEIVSCAGAVGVDSVAGKVDSAGGGVGGSDVYGRTARPTAHLRA